MSKCPKCGNNLQLIEDGKYYCSVCNKTYKTKSQPQYQPVRETPSIVASTQIAESAKDREIELLKARLDALEKKNNQPKQKKITTQSFTPVISFIKKYGIIMLPALLVLIALITLMTCFIGVRGVYVNVDDPNDYYSFTATAYQCCGEDFGEEYVENGTWKISGGKIIFTVSDELFGKLSADFVFSRKDIYKTIFIGEDMDNLKEYKRVSLVKYPLISKNIKITFDTNGGNEDSFVEKIKQGTKLKKFEFTPTKQNREFRGWYTDPYGYKRADGKAFSNENRQWESTRYYANWYNSTDYNITITDIGGITETKPIAKEGDLILPILKSVYDGDDYNYEFYLNQQLIDEKTCMPDSDITVYVKNIGKKQFVKVDGGYSFASYNGNETYFEIPAEYDGLPVVKIGRAAFLNNKVITSVVIPNSVKVIEVDAFAGCTGLSNIKIPDSVTSISETAFQGCDGVTSIIVEEGNVKYRSDGNCLIETSSGAIVLGCEKSVIPQDGCATSISAYAFSGHSDLTSIIIPSSITSIGHGSFMFCTSLASITFNGTKSQWLTIEKGDYWNYNTPDFVIHCIDGDLDKDGNEI